jgi:hypothetical protein
VDPRTGLTLSKFVLSRYKNTFKCKLRRQGVTLTAEVSLLGFFLSHLTIRTRRNEMTAAAKFQHVEQGQLMSQDSSDSTTTRLRVGRKRIPASIPGMGKRFFSSRQRPHRLWGPPSLLYNGQRGLFPRGLKRPGS